jgi:hypothetical protein
MKAGCFDSGKEFSVQLGRMVIGTRRWKLGLLVGQGANWDSDLGRVLIGTPIWAEC